MTRKSLSNTVKVALYTTALTAIATIVAAFIPLWFQKAPEPVPTVAEAKVEPSQLTTPTDQDLTKLLTMHPGEFQPIEVRSVEAGNQLAAVSLVCSLTGLDVAKVGRSEFHTFELANSKSRILSFQLAGGSSANGLDGEFYNGLVAFHDDIQELIYYDSTSLGEGVEFLPLRVNGREFILIEYHGGSGNFMTISYLQFDGILKPKVKPLVDGLEDGGSTFMANRFFVFGQNSRFEVKEHDGTLSTAKFSGRYESPPTNTMHVFRLDVEEGKPVVRFDSRLLNFSKGPDGNMEYKSIALPLGSVIVVDDNNGTTEDSVKWGYDGDGISSSTGFFDQIAFKKLGIFQVHLRDLKSRWYSIEFLVSTPEQWNQDHEFQ